MKNKFGKFAFPVKNQEEVDALSTRLYRVANLRYRNGSTEADYDGLGTKVLHLNYWETDKDVLSESGSIDSEETVLTFKTIKNMSDDTLLSVIKNIPLEEVTPSERKVEIALTASQVAAISKIRVNSGRSNYPAWNLLRSIRDADEDDRAIMNTIIDLADVLNGRDKEVDFIKFLVGEPTEKYDFIQEDKKFIIEGKRTDDDGDTYYYENSNSITYIRRDAQVFDTYEEAQEAAGWAGRVVEL